MNHTNIINAARQILTKQNQPRNTWPTPGHLAQHLDPRTQNTPALKLIDAHLTQLLDTPDGRLIISIPPQEGKSVRCSRDFPIWALLQNPELRIVTASYGQSLANRNGRTVRNTITAHPELGLTIAHDNGAAAEWTLAGHNGGVLAVGRGAGVTGRAADCIRGSVNIYSEHGRITAEDAYRRGITRILAYDHTNRRPIWCNVEAARRINSRRTVEITTKAGRVLACTPDHRVYTGRGYVPAGNLRNGDTLVAIVDAGRMPMRNGLPKAADGHTQSNQARPESLLLGRVRDNCRSAEEPKELLRMREADPAHSETDMLESVRRLQACPESSPNRLSPMPDNVSSRVASKAILLPNMREPGTLGKDARSGELSLQDGYQLREMVPINAAIGTRARRVRMRCMPAEGSVRIAQKWQDHNSIWVSSSSPEREALGQSSRELDYALPRLSHDAPQVICDTVSVVRKSSGNPVSVYDFQVEGARNFFADDLLVHNCLIIDDPLKDRAEADSATIRDTCWDWWTDALAARLAPGAPALLIMTRWHEDDLAGRLIAYDTRPGWRVLNIPAQCDNPATDPLGRNLGEYMQSARGRTLEQWEQRKHTAGPTTWASLYQGHPSPPEGGIFNRRAWQYYRTPPAQFDTVIQSWDLAFKGGPSSDYVVGQVWGRVGANLYLLDQARGRWGFNDTVTQIRNTTARWPDAHTKLVEDKANGSAVIDYLKNEIPGLTPVNPEGGKEARAAIVEPFLAAGNIHLPDPALFQWVAELVEEAAGFPNATHDDQVDALTQAVTHLMVTRHTHTQFYGF